MNTPIELNAFTTLTLGFIAMVVGEAFNRRAPVLRRMAIPAAVIGGACLAVMHLGLQAAWQVEFHLDTAVRDWALLYFFTSVGLNLQLDALRVGGRALLLLLAATLVYMCLQNSIGIGLATWMDKPPVFGIIGGTASLIGGHGTVVAWAPLFEERFGVTNALEMGTACATLGLLLASVTGSVVGKFLIQRHRLSTRSRITEGVLATVAANHCTLQTVSLLYHLLLVQALIGIGHLLHAALQTSQVQLPLFMTCMLAGLAYSFATALFFRNPSTHHSTRYTALTGEISLGLLLATSLMGMDLQAIYRNSGPLILILLLQALVASAYAILVIYRLLGRNYAAAMVSSGFSGISLGATPTAMANMGSLARQYGPSRKAFLIVPLVSACLIDVANAIFINLFVILH